MKVIVIGAGASGLASALEAAKRGYKVIVLELKNEAGKKIYSTGNGRCNITNKKMGVEYYNCDDYDFLEEILKEFTYKDMQDYFNKLGLKLTSIGDYVYPYSKRAASVVNVLLSACLEFGVEFVYNCNVKNIEKTKEGFVVTGNVLENKDYKKKYFTGDKVIVAAGGKAAKALGSDGSGYYLLSKLSHNVNEVVPALVPLMCSDSNKKAYMKALAGVRSDAAIKVLDSNGAVAAKSLGEVQFTDYGVSGIVVFQISGKVNQMLKNSPKVDLVLDLMADISSEDLRADIIEYIKRHIISYKKKNQDIESANRFIENNLNEKLAKVIVEKTKAQFINYCKDNKSIAEDYIDILVNNIKGFKIQIVASKDFDNAQVCRGGVSLKEVNESFESKIIKGMYIVGEVLDVDGICGGYNLHFAFASGIIAGRNV